MRRAATCAALAAAALLARTAHAQNTASPPARSASTAVPAAQPATQLGPVISASDQRRAAKWFLDASRLYAKGRFEEALQDYKQAAALDPTNSDYPLAAEVARSHAVTALLQEEARSKIRGDVEGARMLLRRALALDPKNLQAAEHLYELQPEPQVEMANPLYDEGTAETGAAPELEPMRQPQSFHLRTDQRTLLQQVFRAYGIQAIVDMSVRATHIRFDLDHATFQEAARAATLATGSFYAPLDAHRALIAMDTRENREQLIRQDLETVYLPGLTATDLTHVGNMARTVFEASQVAVEQTASTITLRAPRETLDAFNETMHKLLDGRNQVMLDVRMFQLAHTNERNTGVQLPQQIGAFNLYSEADSILTANQSLVQQIIASGLASPTDYLSIIAILLASGQVSNPLLSNGFATIGGGAISTFGVAPGTGTVTLNLNSSDSRELDQLQLRLGDDETGTLRSGTRYPIQTSSYSSLSATGINIPGLTGAGSSSALSSLLASMTAVPPIPQVQYQDLGLTLKATPKVMRGDDVALTIDMKIEALAGTSINGNPVLNNRSYSGVVTLREGEAAIISSEIDKQESIAISGTPGLTEVPGLSNVTGKDVSLDYATLLIVMTPHVIRGTQAAGHTPTMRIEPAAGPR